jgi:hypothetical protein
VQSRHKKKDYLILIDAGSKHFVSGKDVNSVKMEDHALIHTLINIIIKEAFRGTNLRQIGKAPRFFDVKHSITIPDAGL